MLPLPVGSRSRKCVPLAVWTKKPARLGGSSLRAVWWLAIDRHAPNDTVMAVGRRLKTQLRPVCTIACCGHCVGPSQCVAHASVRRMLGVRKVVDGGALREM
jgi:hypothetical protein